MFLQIISCYGLLDIDVIQSPVPTGQYLELPYYAGSRYVAYRPSQTDQVNFIVLTFLSLHNNIQDDVCLQISSKTSVLDPLYQRLAYYGS